jgi:hypothetical protein
VGDIPAGRVQQQQRGGGEIRRPRGLSLWQNRNKRKKRSKKRLGGERAIQIQKWMMPCDNRLSIFHPYVSSIRDLHRIGSKFSQNCAKIGPPLPTLINHPQWIGFCLCLWLAAARKKEEIKVPIQQILRPSANNYLWVAASGGTLLLLSITLFPPSIGI